MILPKILILKLRKLAKQVETFSPAQPLLLLRWEARVRNILQIVFAIVIVAAIFSYRTGAGMVASNATNAQGEGTTARYMIKKKHNFSSKLNNNKDLNYVNFHNFFAFLNARFPSGLSR